MSLLREWLIETVGFEADRAQIVAEQLQKCGIRTVQQLTARRQSKSRSSGTGSHLLSNLDIELEEWEAVALACATGNDTCDDDMVAYHAMYSNHMSGWSAACARDSAPLDKPTEDSLLVEIFSSSSAEEVIPIAKRLTSYQFRVSYKILIEFHSLIARLCARSIVHVHQLLAEATTLLPVFTRSLLCNYNPCICSCLQALTTLAHPANHNRRPLCCPALLLLVEHLPEHGAEVIEHALSLLDLLAACPDNLPLLCRVEIHPLDGQACTPPLLPDILLRLLSRYSARTEVVMLVLPVVTGLCAHPPARDIFQSSEALVALVAAVESISEDVKGVEHGLWMLCALLDEATEESIGFLLMIRLAEVVFKVARNHARSSIAIAESCFHTLSLLLYRPAHIVQYLSHTLSEALDTVCALLQDVVARLSIQALFHAGRSLQALLRGARLQASAHITLRTTHTTDSSRLDVSPVFFCTLSAGPQLLSAAVTLLQCSFLPLQRYCTWQGVDAQVAREVLTEAVLALQVQSEALQICGLLLEGGSVWWCALARDLQATSTVINGKLYLPHLLSPTPLAASEDPVMLRTLVRLYLLLDQVARQAKKKGDTDVLWGEILEVAPRETSAVLHLVQDAHLHSAMQENGQEILPAIGRLLSLFYMTPNTAYVTCAVTCMQVLLQHREARRSQLPQPRLCQLFSRLLLYFSQVLSVRDDQVDEGYLGLQAILQCLELLTMHGVHREVLGECGVGKMLVDLLGLLDQSSFLPSLPAPLPPLASPSRNASHASVSPSPVASSQPKLLAMLSSQQSAILRGLAFQCLTHLSLDAAPRLSLVRQGLGKLSVLTLLHRGVGNAMLREHILRLLVVLAEDHRMFLGECGLCEALAFLVHHEVPLLHPQAVISQVDEALVHLSCQLICNLCRDHQENQQRLKKTGVLLWLQVLIGKFHSFISNPVRMDVKDAINAIKF